MNFGTFKTIVRKLATLRNPVEISARNQLKNVEYFIKTFGSPNKSIDHKHQFVASHEKN